ncbi:Uncharacterised protein [Actinomadura madurae]|nr:Uncharacterised protein [Actinomadura madurae]
MLTARREGHAMSPTHPRRRRAASTAIVATIVTAPVLTAVPAVAAPCIVPGKLSCNPRTSTTVPGGGGGNGGGGGGGGPVAPPDPEGLIDNQAVDAVDGPGAAPLAAAPPNTLELVQQALSEKAFPVPKVHTAPRAKTYVRMRTALWVDNFEVVQTAPVSAGDQTVQATAQPKSVTWNLGEDKLVCNNAGSKDGKSCNYTYKRASAGQPSGRYEITATITWHVTWTCEGADCDAPGGDLGDQTMTSQPTPLVVSEIQTNTGQ